MHVRRMHPIQPLACCKWVERSDWMDDALLWADVVRGDRDAMAALYDRHASAAYGLAARLVGWAAAEDVVHDSFVVVLVNAAAYDPERGAFRSWLLRVVHNRSMNLLR